MSKSNKYWNPAKVGAKQEGEVTAYTVAIPNLPLVPNKRVKKFVDYISKLDGFIGLRPEYPYGTLLIFDTRINANSARNLIKSYPNYEGGVGENICECFIPREYAEQAKGAKKDEG